MNVSHLKDELITMLEMEIGFCGKFILQKQCDILGIGAEEDIEIKDLRELSRNLKTAISGFIGDRKSKLVFRNLLEYSKALETLDDETSETMDCINAFLTVGDKRLVLRRYDASEDAYRDAYDLFQDSQYSGNRRMKMKIKRKLARVLGTKTEGHEMAIKEYYGVITIGKRHRNYYDTALSYCGLGWIAFKDSDEHLSLEYYEKALSTIENMKEQTKLDRIKKMKVKCIINSGLADIYKSMNEVDIAIDLTESAIDLNLQLENYVRVGELYDKMAQIYEQKRDYEKAVEGYKQVLSNTKEGGSLLTEGWTLINLASLLINEGKFDQAEEYLSRASRILSKFNDCEAQSRLHYMYGEYYQKLREWENSETHFKASLESMINVDSPECLARVQEGLGTLYHIIGESEKATPLLNSALTWYEKNDDKDNIKKIGLLIHNSQYVPLGISILKP